MEGPHTTFGLEERALWQAGFAMLRETGGENGKPCRLNTHQALKELQESVWEQHRRNVRPGLQDAEPAGKLRPGAPLQKKGKMLNTSKDVSLCMKKTGNHSELKGHTTSDAI